MKKAMMFCGAVVAGILAVEASGTFTPIQVKTVSSRQDRRTFRLEVDYTLESDGAALVRLDVLTNGVSIGMENIKSLDGDVSRNFSTFVEPGQRHLSWSARSDWPGYLESNVVAVVRAWPTNGIYTVPGSYMVVDISGGASAAAYPVSYTFDAPNPAVDANLSTKIWLKYCPPGTYLMGSPTTEIGRGSNEDQHQVTLTEPFFAGVFNVTRAQYTKVAGALPFSESNTYENDFAPAAASWDDIRGEGCVWPASNNVAAASFMGLLRAKTGIDSFDLPTEGQWEYAARAGETNAYYNGFSFTEPCPYTANTHSAYTHPEIAEIAWVRPETNNPFKRRRAGTKKPNNWGLYDVVGNIYEWCLDNYAANLGKMAVTNPVGPETGTNPVIRSMGIGGTCVSVRSAYRRGDKAKSLHDTGFGFRIFCTVR